MPIAIASTSKIIANGFNPPFPDFISVVDFTAVVDLADFAPPFKFPIKKYPLKKSQSTIKNPIVGLC